MFSRSAQLAQTRPENFFHFVLDFDFSFCNNAPSLRATRANIPHRPAPRKQKNNPKQKTMNYEEARQDAACALNAVALIAIAKHDRELAADAHQYRTNLLAAVGDAEIARALALATAFLANI